MTQVIDTSALLRGWRAGRAARDAIRGAVERGEICVIEPVRLEIARGADSPAQARSLVDELSQTGAPSVTPECWRQAERTLVGLATLRGGRHRGVSVVDLLVAAVAHVGGLTVLHHDRDFELIASVTGQPVRWFAAPAS